MRLAVIADIHGNVAALEAVLADVRARGADGIVNLGDCVSGPLWPRETLDLLESWAPTVRGNHDRWVERRPRGHVPIRRLAFDRLTPAQRSALGALPARVDPDGGIVAVHGTLADDNQYLLEDVVGGALFARHAEAIALRAGAIRPMSCCAATRISRAWRADRRPADRHPGSVGCPAYADPTPPSLTSPKPAARTPATHCWPGRPDAGASISSPSHTTGTGPPPAPPATAAPSGRARWRRAMSVRSVPRRDASATDGPDARICVRGVRPVPERWYHRLSRHGLSRMRERTAD